MCLLLRLLYLIWGIMWWERVLKDEVRTMHMAAMDPVSSCLQVQLLLPTHVSVGTSINDSAQEPVHELNILLSFICRQPDRCYNCCRGHITAALPGSNKLQDMEARKGTTQSEADVPFMAATNGAQI